MQQHSRLRQELAATMALVRGARGQQQAATAAGCMMKRKQAVSACPGDDASRTNRTTGKQKGNVLEFGIILAYMLGPDFTDSAELDKLDSCLVFLHFYKECLSREFRAPKITLCSGSPELHIHTVHKPTYANDVALALLVHAGYSNSAAHACAWRSRHS